MSDRHISVVMPTCDRPADLRAALGTLLAQRTDGRFTYDVMVVDDGSGDETGVVVRQMAAVSPVTVRTIRTAKAGVARARNAGAEAAPGPWIACFDDDQAAPEHWLAALLDAADRAGARCVSGPRTLALPPGNRPPLSKMARVLLGEHDLPAGTEFYPADRRVLPNTGNALIHRSVFERVGGFDPTFQGGSDTDFFLRVLRAGFAIAYAGDACVVHIIPESRLEPRYLRWVAQKVGAASARVVLRNHGRARVVGTLAQRAAVTALRDLPRITVRTLTGDQAGRVDTSCTMAYSWAYARAALALAMPAVFAGRGYVASLDFRRHGGERRETVSGV